jgi:hypothetical protein
MQIKLAKLFQFTFVVRGMNSQGRNTVTKTTPSLLLPFSLTPMLHIYFIRRSLGQGYLLLILSLYNLNTSELLLSSMNCGKRTDARTRAYTHLFVQLYMAYVLQIVGGTCVI